MKASRLIDELKKEIQKNGDYDVCVFHGKETSCEPIGHIHTCLYAPPNQKMNMIVVMSPRQIEVWNRTIAQASAQMFKPVGGQ